MSSSSKRSRTASSDDEYYPVLGRSYPRIHSKEWKSKKILKRLAKEHPQFYEHHYGEEIMRKKRAALQLLPESQRNKRIPLIQQDLMRCVEASLSHWNEKSLSNKGPEYELVEAVGCLSIRIPSIYHCNFIARPKDSTKNMLFFAELKHDYTGGYDYAMRAEPPPLCCLFCCTLGSPDTKTGLCGCKICDLDPGLIQHPERGVFQRKGRFPYPELKRLTDDEVDNFIASEMYVRPSYYCDPE